MSKAEVAALDEIANYILPVYTFEGQKYVKLEHAQHLRDTAREALHSGMKKSKDAVR